MMLRLQGMMDFTFALVPDASVRWFLRPAADLVWVGTTGTQRQRFYDGSDDRVYRISQEIDSIQASIMFSTGLLF